MTPIECLKAMREAYQQLFDVMPVAWQTYDDLAEQVIKEQENAQCQFI